MEFCIFLGTRIASLAAHVGITQLRNWRIARRKMRVPVAEKLLRSPGESLRKKLETLEGQISVEVAVTFVLPLVYVGSVLFQARTLQRFSD